MLYFKLKKLVQAWQATDGHIHCWECWISNHKRLRLFKLGKQLTKGNESPFFDGKIEKVILVQEFMQQSRHHPNKNKQKSSNLNGPVHITKIQKILKSAKQIAVKNSTFKKVVKSRVNMEIFSQTFCNFDPDLHFDENETFFPFAR